jgi:hypothetical protein
MVHELMDDAELAGEGALAHAIGQSSSDLADLCLSELGRGDPLAPCLPSGSPPASHQLNLSSVAFLGWASASARRYRRRRASVTRSRFSIWEM